MGAAEVRINSILASADAVDVEGEKLVRTKDIIEAGEKIRWDALVRAAGVHDKARLRGLTEIREFAGCGKKCLGSNLRAPPAKRWIQGFPMRNLNLGRAGG